jgi:ssDNA-binding Zn-finger/Zn-ribbon topoisomerase 1
MPVRIVCPHCHQALRLPEELYEGPVQCPRCKGGIALRWHPRGLGRFRDGDVQPADDPTRRCRFCGAALDGAPARCPACGEAL